MRDLKMLVPELEARVPMNCQPVLVHVATPPRPFGPPCLVGQGPVQGRARGAPPTGSRPISPWRHSWVCRCLREEDLGRTTQLFSKYILGTVRWTYEVKTVFTTMLSSNWLCPHECRWAFPEVT